MKTEQTKSCKCDKAEIDTNLHSYAFYLCKNCGGALKRKESICVYFLTSGYCRLAATKQYTINCRVNGDFTKCKNGKGT